MAPELATLAPQLSDEQVIYLFAALEKDNKEIEDDRFDGSEEDKRKAREKDFVKQLKTWIGKPDKRQKQIISVYTPQFRSTFEQWLQYRKRIQTEARRLFANRHINPDFSSQLEKLLINPDQYKTPEYLQNSVFNSNLFAAMAEELTRSLTAKQRRKFIKEIQSYIDDITDLMED